MSVGGLKRNQPRQAPPGGIYEPCGMLDWYKSRAAFQAQAGLRGRKGGRLPFALDPIPPELVGCADIRVLRQEAVRCGLGRDILRALSYLGGAGVHPERKSPSEMEQDPRPIPEVRVHPFVVRQIQQITDIGLVREITDIKHKERLRQSQPRCGVFGVEKSGKKVVVKGEEYQAARLVFDARPGNRVLRRIPVNLSLFTLHLLLEALSLFPGAYTVSKDMRHYYYQWRICEVLGEFFIIVVQVGSEEYRVFVPRVLLMGYSDACVMAQAATWAMTMLIPQGEERLESGEGPELGLPASVRRSVVLPRMAWLREGSREDGRRIGAIFVLLDGVFVLAEDESLRNDWRRRLEANARRCKIIIKDDVDSNDRQPLEFAGVHMQARVAGAVTAIRPASRDKTMPVFSGGYNRRELAGAIGRALWVCRVRQADPQTLGFVAGLAASVNPADGNWDSQCDPGRDAMRKLRAVLQEHCSDICRPPNRGPRQCKRVRMIATDATPTRWGWVELRDGRVTKFGASPEYVVARDQVLMEMMAVDGMIGQLEDFDPEEEMLLLAIDADSVTHAIGKGYSGSEGMREELQKLRGRGVVILARRVAGVDNLGDLPSRGSDPIRALRGEYGKKEQSDARRRLEATWLVLEALRREAL